MPSRGHTGRVYSQSLGFFLPTQELQTAVFPLVARTARHFSERVPTGSSPSSSLVLFDYGMDFIISPHGGQEKFYHFNLKKFLTDSLRFGKRQKCLWIVPAVGFSSICPFCRDGRFCPLERRFFLFVGDRQYFLPSLPPAAYFCRWTKAGISALRASLCSVALRNTSLRLGENQLKTYGFKNSLCKGVGVPLLPRFSALPWWLWEALRLKSSPHPPPSGAPSPRGRLNEDRFSAERGASSRR